MSKNYLAEPSQLRIVRGGDDDCINTNDFCYFTPVSDRRKVTGAWCLLGLEFLFVHF